MSFNKRHQYNTKAFTLLELIIVIIIVGVLASLASVGFSKTITQSRATEAIAYMRVIARSIDRCLITGIITDCIVVDSADFSNLDNSDANTDPSAYFTYGICRAGTCASPVPAGSEYIVHATSKTNAADFIVYVQYTTQADDLAGFGVFLNVKSKYWPGVN